MSESPRQFARLVGMLFFIAMPPYVAMYLIGAAIMMDWNWWANIDKDTRLIVFIFSLLGIFTWLIILSIAGNIILNDEEDKR